ncbi:NADPH-dependent FMN FAD containing oxidoreductase [Cryptosporidium ubiquitum]|uniref:NADPH-dependent FMN FAD containing oxidoreductase n=1 Tax=Cryptosporidium ubiquitum TaxID=857276 RepID=A0A1J4MDC5_9CRYT|nr:NADPH-dependent FMN FAD containing oxidoreductase [Cryptosporidium ubiquitum]OII72240.1 NADPH-dependent FMN FAD containing oxidoreductase [Cryptosporidium ubiquitum]
MECPERVWIVYASQTGKSERLSYDVRDELWKVGVIGYPTSISEFEDIFFDYFEEESQENINKKLEIEFPMTIFILSTTGQGEVPDTMTSFWNRILMNNLNTILIKKLNFAIFGMGDRCFGNQRFNITARKLRHLLLNCGAVEKVPWGLGDESHDFGILGEYDPWIENIIKMFKHNTEIDEYFKNNLPINQYKCEIKSYNPEKVIQDINYEFDIELENELKNSLFIQKKHISDINKKNISFPSISNVLYNQECDKESKNKKIKKIRFGLSHEDQINYKSGTHLAIWPVNPIEKVIHFIDLFNQEINPKTIIEIQFNHDYYTCLCNKQYGCKYNSTDDYLDLIKYKKCYIECKKHQFCSQFPLGEKMTVFTLIYRYLDIMSVPERRFVNKCYNNTNNHMHKERLKEMIQRSVDSKKDYCDYIKDEHRNYLELLWDFNSIELQIDDIINFIPVIIPRYYSICNTLDWYKLNLWRYIDYENYIRRMTVGIFNHCFEYDDDNDNGDVNHHHFKMLLPEILSNTLGLFLPKIKVNNNNNNNNQLLIINNYNTFKKLKTKVIQNYIVKLKEKYLYNMMQEFKSIYCDQEYAHFNNSNIIEICVDVIEWNTTFNRKIRGLCSGYLDDIIYNNKTLIAFENKISDEIIKELVDPKIPLLLISCGLGITGIISILQERVINILRQRNVNHDHKNEITNNTLVYIGLRYSNVMYPYIDQIYEFSKRKELIGQIQFNISYSRKNPGIKESIFKTEKTHKLVNLNHLRSGCYIQSLLLNEDNEIDNMREYIVNCILNGYILICGNALSMPIEIRETLAKILVLSGKFDTIEDSLIYIKKLIRYGRYIEETWV